MPTSSKIIDTKQGASKRSEKSPQVAKGPGLILTKDDIYLFGHGIWQRAWEKMGAHKDIQNGEEGWLFRVWAPKVASVHVVGDFNGWDPQATPLTRAEDIDI